MPPGPPVLQTLVAEIYGPDRGPTAGARTASERRCSNGHAGVVDVDWYVESPQPKTTLIVDELRARRRWCVAGGCGVSRAAGQRRDARRAAARPVRRGKMCRSSSGSRARPGLARRPCANSGSGPHSVAIGELTRETGTTEVASLYHKNLLPVTYVTGDLAGVAESPVYAILQMNEALERFALPEGYALRDLQHAAAVRHDQVRDEVGWRVAHHLRGVPRPRPGVRGRAGPDLHPRGRGGSSASACR